MREFRLVIIGGGYVVKRHHVIFFFIFLLSITIQPLITFAESDGKDKLVYVIPIEKEVERGLEAFLIRSTEEAIEAGANVITITNETTMYAEVPEPTTLSPLATQLLLREKLGFDGVIMTEDLLDEKITTYTSPAEAAIHSLEAGVDMIVVSHHETEQINVLEAINEAVKSGRITEERIDASLERILRLKEDFITHRFVTYDQDVFRNQWSVKLENLLTEKALATTI